MMLFNNVGVEITLNNPEDFLKVKETLTRIGIASVKDKTIYQSCHILHKKDRENGVSRYAIVHFKELFKLDGKQDTITEEDLARRNTIATLLSDWGLVEIVVDAQRGINGITGTLAPISKIKILPFKDKAEWQLVAKYNIGKKK